MNRLKKVLLLIILVFTTASSAFCFRVLADADKTSLTQAKNAVESIINNQDTSVNGNSYYNITAYRAFFESVDDLGGVTGIQLVIDDALAIQADVDDLVTDIYGAIDGLVLYETYNLVLNNILQAKSMNLSTYTLNSQSLYLNELERIETILYNPTSGETAIQALSISIVNSEDLLVPLANRLTLLGLYDQLRSAEVDGFTENSIIAYNLELNNLYELIYSPNLDEALADNVLLQLNEVSDLLELLPDYSNLQTRYDGTLNYRMEDYSVSSFRALTDAQQDALDLLSDLNATQQEVDNMETTLFEAMRNLQQRIDKLYIMEGKTLDINQYITLGSAKIISYIALDNIILSVDDEGLVTAKNYGETILAIYLTNGAVENISIYVTAKPKVAVYVLTFSIPVVSIGIAISMIYIKKDTWKILATTFRKIFKKRN